MAILKSLLQCCFLTVILTVTHSFGQNQQQPITGVIENEDKEPLIGVAVLVKGTNNGTVSNDDGFYSIQAEKGDTLIFSYLGCEDHLLVVGSSSKYDITMKLAEEGLPEVVVIGYGVQKKSHISGAVSKIDMKLIEELPFPTVNDALKGQVAGLDVQMTDPYAGAQPTTRIRGNSSIRSGANPLIVIDGISVSRVYLASMNLNQVASIEVLKDAASTAMFGSRGANGVILITTKKGEQSSPKVSFHSFWGVKKVRQQDGIFSSIGDWSAFVREHNGGELTDEMKYVEAIGTSTDWREVMFEGGMTMNHTLNVFGATEKLKYAAFLGYLLDEGILLSDNFKKYNIGLDFGYNINKHLEIGMKLNPSYSSQKLFPIGEQDAIRSAPWLPIYHTEHSLQFVDRTLYPDVKVGDYAFEDHFNNFDFFGDGTPINIRSMVNTNPFARVVEQDKQLDELQFFGNTYLRVNITDRIFFQSSFGATIRYQQQNDWKGVKADWRGASATSSTYTTYTPSHTVNENILSFQTETGRHEVNAVAGFGLEQYKNKLSSIVGVGYENDFIQTINAAPVITSARTSENGHSLASVFGRLNYAYQGKYLFLLSLRTDGSSRFGKDNRFAFFPATSFAWRVSEEKFLKQSNIISNLKLRASFGVSGNYNIGNYEHLGLVRDANAIVAGEVATGFATTNISNPDLQWEKSTEYNLGIDLGFLKDRIGCQLDVYQKLSNQLLLDEPVPSVTGFTSALVNKGKVRNKGIEVSLSSTNIKKKKFTWFSSAVMHHNKNTLLDIGSADRLVNIIDSSRPSEWISIAGEPTSSFYGYEVKKEIPLEYIVDPFYPINAESEHVYVKDLNGDGAISPEDRTILGSPYPDFVWSLQNSFNYGNFDFNFMFTGSHGAEVRNIDPYFFNSHFNETQDYVSDFPDKDLVERRILTDDIIMDASYVSLQSLVLGYRLPLNWVRKLNLTSVRFYFSGYNLLYFSSSGYSGFNPEGISNLSSTTYGYQIGSTPIHKTYAIGMSVDF